MSLTVGLQAEVFELKLPQGQKFPPEKRENNDSQLSQVSRSHLNVSEWTEQQQTQISHSVPLQDQNNIQEFHQNPKVEDSSIYASSNHTNGHQVPYSASQNNSVIQMPLTAPMIHPNAAYPASTLSGSIHPENYNKQNFQISPETKTTNSYSNYGTQRCSCKPDMPRIPRPRNAFILFRQKYHQTVFGKYSRRPNSEVSKQLGMRWRNLLPEEKEHWNQLAKVEKEMHQKLYPKYKYTPRRKKNKDCPICWHKKLAKSLSKKTNTDPPAAVPVGVPLGPFIPTYSNFIEQSPHPIFQHLSQLPQPAQHFPPSLLGLMQFEYNQAPRYSYPNIYSSIGQAPQFNQFNQGNLPSQNSSISYVNQLSQGNQLNSPHFLIPASIQNYPDNSMMSLSSGNSTVQVDAHHGAQPASLGVPAFCGDIGGDKPYASYDGFDQNSSGNI